MPDVLVTAESQVPSWWGEFKQAISHPIDTVGSFTVSNPAGSILDNDNYTMGDLVENAFVPGTLTDREKKEIANQYYAQDLVNAKQTGINQGMSEDQAIAYAKQIADANAKFVSDYIDNKEGGTSEDFLKKAGDTLKNLGIGTVVIVILAILFLHEFNRAA